MKFTAFRTAMLTAVAAAACTVSVAHAQDAPGQGTPEQDKMFIKMSTQGSEAEIQASKMALKKSKNDDVKQFAQKMIDDHTMLLANMKPFASKMGVPAMLPETPKQKAEAQRLKAKSGAAFDKEYVMAMVGDHHKDLADFKHEVDTTQNQDLKATVQQGEQVIQQHTDMIDAIAQKMNIPTPPAGQ